MEKTVAKKATDLIANLPWGTHCCNFYKAKTDLLGILTPYFKAGLLNKTSFVCGSLQTPSKSKTP
jgi:hypothetical protein